MNLLRRRFLGSSLVVLGSSFLDALTTPLWKWRGAMRLEATPMPDPSVSDSPAVSPVRFVDAAREAGLTILNVWGVVDHKKYIIEAKGSGIAFFDYDHDGWLDIYLTHGTRFDTNWPASKAPTSHLYKNNRDGTFTDVTEKSGLARTGWQTGVCVGDYDNDGWNDLFCCFWGHNILFHNNGDGTFSDVTRKAGVYAEQIRWGAGCTFLDYDRDGHLDLLICNYIKLDPDKAPSPNDPLCQWKGIPVMCGPRGLTGDTNVLYHNNGDGTFANVSEKSGILKPGPRYSITAVSYDFDNDGWPDIYVAVDSEASILYHNNHDGTFTDIAVIAGCAYNEDGQEQAGMGVGVADYDCDGRLDIFKTNFSDDTSDLYRNNGDGTFTDATFVSGVGVNTQFVGWGCGFLDYDNDGWPDILLVNGHAFPEVERLRGEIRYRQRAVLYHNEGGKFIDFSKAAGPGIAEPHAARGAAFGDYDN